MNREIKFRVWDNKYKNWMQCEFSRSGVGDFISSGGRGFSLDYILKNETLTDKIHEEIPFNGSNPRWVVQQYTGLKDEDGKEVYEGDIVNWTEYQGWEDGRTIEGYYEVKWNEEALRLDFYDPYDNSWWELADTKFNQVVGNIFENVELLK